MLPTQFRSQSPRYPCPAVEQPTRTSGGKRSAMTGFLDFRFYCTCVRPHVSTNGLQDSWTSGLTAQVRRIVPPKRTLLAAPRLDKGNENSGNEIATNQQLVTREGIGERFSWLALRFFLATKKHWEKKETAGSLTSKSLIFKWRRRKWLHKDHGIRHR